MTSSPTFTAEAKSAVVEGSFAPTLFRGTIVALILFGLMSGLLLAAGRKDYPNLHTILDTGAFLLSAMLAFKSWNVGANIHRPILKWLAASFAVTSLLELVHVIVVVEWSGPLAMIAQASPCCVREPGRQQRTSSRLESVVRSG